MEINLKITKEHGQICIESKEANITASGDNFTMAFKEFVEDLMYQYDIYNKLPEDKMGKGVKEIKETINYFIDK